MRQTMQGEQAQNLDQLDQIDEFDYLEAEKANFGLEIFHDPTGMQLPNIYFYLYGHSGQGNGVVQRHVETFQNDPLYHYASLQLLKKLALFKNPWTPEKIAQLAKGSKIVQSIRSIMQRRS